MTKAPKQTDESEFSTSRTEITSTADRDLVVSRVYDTPRYLVFRAWTDPLRISEWWGPDGFTTTTRSMDVRPGGAWDYVMHGPDGVDWPNYVAYIDVVAPERLVYAHGEYAGRPAEFETTVTFVDRDGKTEVTLRALFPTAEVRDRNVAEHGAVEGGKQTLARLAEQLETAASEQTREFVTSRLFAAPRELVFNALTEPERLLQWFGPSTWPMASCEVDLRVGGTWRYCMRGPGGEEAWGKGVYEEITPPALIVYMDYFTDADGNTVPGMPASRSTFHLMEEGAGTRLTVRAVYPTEEDYQKVLEMGMEAGVTETWEQLAKHLATAMLGERGEFTVTRIFDAPREMVFKAYVDPEQFIRHFAPEGLSIPLDRLTLDARPGGTIELVMVSDDDGSEHPVKGTFVDVVAPERISFIEHNMGLTSTMTFRDVGGKTELTLRQTGVPLEYLGPEAIAGVNSSFDLLAIHLRELREGSQP